MKKVFPFIVAALAAAFIVSIVMALLGYPIMLEHISSFLSTWGFFLAILGVIYVIYRSMRRKNEAKKWTDGRVGVGTIQRYSHSGRYNNVRTYSLTMQVESEDGHTFIGNMNPQVGRRHLPDLAPGTKIPVCFSAAKATQLFVPHGPLKARAQLFFEYIQQRDGIISQTAIDAKYRGQPCRATVQGVRQSGYREGSAVQWTLELQVFTPDGQQFPSTAKVLLNKAQYDLLRRANYVEAKYLPHDTSEVAVKIPTPAK